MKENILAQVSRTQRNEHAAVGGTMEGALRHRSRPCATARTWSSAWRTASRNWPTADCRRRRRRSCARLPKGMSRRQTGAARTAPSPAHASMREWNGERHEVTVTRDGYEYRGRPFKSLSAIARAITGTRWNGPLFFGIRKQEEAA